LKCGAGEGWSSAEPTVGKKNKYYIKPRRKIISPIKIRGKGNWIGHILRRN
jgi:hypothetical protein